MKVLLISVDGMRPDALPKVKNAQNIISRSAYNMNAQTVMPSVTLPCHISMFHSVDPSRHGTTTNTYMPQVRPIDGLCEVLVKNKKKKRCILQLGGAARSLAPCISRTFVLYQRRKARI